MRSTIEAWTACSGSIMGVAGEEGREEVAALVCTQRPGTVASHFAVHGALCTPMSLMPGASSGNQSPTRSISKMRTQSLRETRPLPQVRQQQGPPEGEGKLAPRGIIPHPADGCGHLLNGSYLPKLTRFPGDSSFLPGLGRLTPGQPLFLPFHTVQCV